MVETPNGGHLTQIHIIFFCSVADFSSHLESILPSRLQTTRESFDANAKIPLQFDAIVDQLRPNPPGTIQGQQPRRTRWMGLLDVRIIGFLPFREILARNRHRAREDQQIQRIQREHPTVHLLHHRHHFSACRQ